MIELSSDIGSADKHKQFSSGFRESSSSSRKAVTDRTSGQIPVICAENLVKTFGIFHKVNSVNGISFQINSGEIVGLLGGNGAGKSTTFDMLSGLTRPTGGKISLFDSQTQAWIPITNVPLYRRALHGICYLPQKPSVFAGLTTRQNLLGIMEIMSSRDLKKSMEAYDPSLQTREDFCDSLLTLFDLYKRRDEKVSKLSGGEKRRLEIARSFIRKPRLILMDEPFAAVDIPGIDICGQMFRKVRDMGVSILIVDHRVDEILKLCDRAIYLENGIIHAEGKPWEIVRVPAVQRNLLLALTESLLKMFPEPEEKMNEKIQNENFHGENESRFFQTRPTSTSTTVRVEEI
ncbi:MAG: ATP-binding cassette domain-containing protein [Thermoguttaceae bacterium]|nr:ATP-binding cassette domain-containing protein [Thermoguttaceae bacterium]